MMDDEAIHDLVVRLARPRHQGGHVIERAAILAAGSDSAAVEAWILSHAGLPEGTAPTATAPGLHGGRIQKAAQPSRRFLFPQGALTTHQQAGQPAADKEFSYALEAPLDHVDTGSQTTHERD
jgi:hypothetical protein